jgi:hypothetical protein
MSRLSEILERFNRKERNLAVRFILGHVEEPPPLSRSARLSRRAARCSISLRVPAN